MWAAVCGGGDGGKWLLWLNAGGGWLGLGAEWEGAGPAGPSSGIAPQHLSEAMQAVLMHFLLHFAEWRQGTKVTSLYICLFYVETPKHL